MTKMKNDVFRVGDVIKTFHFRVFFKKKVLFHKPQRLKYNVWNATLFVFRVSFSRTFSKHNVWKATLLVFGVSFYRTFSKISRLSQTATFENTTLLLISLKCLHYRYKIFNFIDNAAYRFNYNDNSCTISFIWLLGYLKEIPQWERGHNRKHPRSTTQHNEKSRKYQKTPEKRTRTPTSVLWRHLWWR